jgi:hypothetical protein
MALFFDARWFDARLAALSLTRADLANAIGVRTHDLALIFKDQMEVTASQVQAWADLLDVGVGEVALRCGVSTPVLEPTTSLAALEARVALLERRMAALITQQGPRFR